MPSGGGSEPIVGSWPMVPCREATPFRRGRCHRCLDPVSGNPDTVLVSTAILVVTFDQLLTRPVERIRPAAGEIGNSNVISPAVVVEYDTIAGVFHTIAFEIFVQKRLYLFGNLGVFPPVCPYIDIAHRGRWMDLFGISGAVTIDTPADSDGFGGWVERARRKRGTHFESAVCPRCQVVRFPRVA